MMRMRSHSPEAAACTQVDINPNTQQQRERVREREIERTCIMCMYIGTKINTETGIRMRQNFRLSSLGKTRGGHTTYTQVNYANSSRKHAHAQYAGKREFLTCTMSSKDTHTHTHTHNSPKP